MSHHFDHRFLASQASREKYLMRISQTDQIVWWDAVIVTAGSRHQATRYQEEISRRIRDGRIPPRVRYLVVVDPGERHVGSGGATLNALAQMATEGCIPDSYTSLESWWECHRVLMIHAGGEARRIPQYSNAGKLFGVVSMIGSSLNTSTVFDEFLVHSTAWVNRLDSGLVVASGDVLLILEDEKIQWNRPGVSGVAVRQSAEVGANHGVYVRDEKDRVYSFLQKPSLDEVRSAGGALDHGCVAVDSGLLRFDPTLCETLAQLAGARRIDGKWTRPKAEDPFLQVQALPEIDLYVHFTMSLTGRLKGQRMGSEGSPTLMARLSSALGQSQFWCSLVEGEIRHFGTTRAVRNLLTDASVLESYAIARRTFGLISTGSAQSSGFALDSVLEGGGELGKGSLVIECHLSTPVYAAPGAVLHGLEGFDVPLEVPEDTVVHQLPIRLSEGKKGVVFGVYGVEDDPKLSLPSSRSTWFGRPLLEVLNGLEIPEHDVWEGIAPEDRSLWNARLFPVADRSTAWRCARWLMGIADTSGLSEWKSLSRLSLETSAQLVDQEAQEEARAHRALAGWRDTAFHLASIGSDVRPILANAPNAAALAAVARRLQEEADGQVLAAPTFAASLCLQASLLATNAGLTAQAEAARARAFQFVATAVEKQFRSPRPGGSHLPVKPWTHSLVTVSAPARIDLGGGWSDTPPFCIDWGGTVLNAAVSFEGRSPIRTTVRRIPDLLVRCISEDNLHSLEARHMDELLAQWTPYSVHAIACTALRMTGWFNHSNDLSRTLTGLGGGGGEIRTSVDLPLGSGLGASPTFANSDREFSCSGRRGRG